MVDKKASHGSNRIFALYLAIGCFILFGFGVVFSQANLHIIGIPIAIIAVIASPLVLLTALVGARGILRTWPRWRGAAAATIIASSVAFFGWLSSLWGEERVVLTNNPVTLNTDWTTLTPLSPMLCERSRQEVHLEFPKEANALTGDDRIRSSNGSAVRPEVELIAVDGSTHSLGGYSQLSDGGITGKEALVFEPWSKSRGIYRIESILRGIRIRSDVSVVIPRIVWVCADRI